MKIKKIFCFVFFFIFIFYFGLNRYSAAVGQPELPRAYVDTSFPSRTGATINVKSGNNLQLAIDSAKPGDEIILEAGSVFVGPIILRNKNGNGWIIIKTSNLSVLPQNKRISPSDSANLAKIVSPGSNLPALKTEASAHNYRIVGIEFAKSSPGAVVDELISLGQNNSNQITLQSVPTNIILDRVYVHGENLSDLKRCIGLNSASSAVIDSYIADCHAMGVDSQAISGFNGPGPFKIINNYLEASSENILFGGDDPKIPNLIPSDIEIQKNHFTKKLSWRVGDPSFAGKSWSIKNIFELKNAQRVYVNGNIFENSWVMAQTGFAILLNTTNQGGKCGWCQVADVTFSNNIIRHAAAGVQMQGNDWHFPTSSGRTQRIKFTNNLFEDINGVKWGDLSRGSSGYGNGWLFHLPSGSSEPGPEDVEIIHNTAIHSGMTIEADKFSQGIFWPKNNFIFQNNIVGHNSLGVFGDGGGGIGSTALNNYFPGAIFTKNLIVGTRSSTDLRDWSGLYPKHPGNLFPKTWSDVGFINFLQNDYSLNSSSAYKNSASDGKDPGADIASLNSATLGVISGQGTSSTPTPTPSTTQTPTPTPTPTITPTPSLAPTPTPTITPTPTLSITPTPTPNLTPTQTPTITPSPSSTSTPTQTPTPAPSPSLSTGPIPIISPAPSRTPIPTFSPVPTPKFDPEPSVQGPKLIRISGDPKVYELMNNKLKWIPSPDVFNRLNFSWNSIETKPLTNSTNFQRVKLIRTENDSRIFYITENGFKRWIPNPEIFSSYDNKWEDVMVVKHFELSAIPENTLIKLENGERVYKIEGIYRRWITSPAAFNKNEFKWENIAPVNSVEMNFYKVGKDI